MELQDKETSPCRNKKISVYYSVALIAVLIVFALVTLF